MAPLSILLWIKIVGTFFPVAAPLLLFPKSKIDELSGFSPSDVSLYRLYGLAVLALLVGYAGGFFQVVDGEFPIGSSLFWADRSWTGNRFPAQRRRDDAALVKRATSAEGERVALVFACHCDNQTNRAHFF
mgnify:CR=1 FL=1